MKTETSNQLLELFRQGQETMKQAADLIEKSQILEKANSPHRTPFELLLQDLGIEKEAIANERLSKIETRFSIKLKLQIEP